MTRPTAAAFLTAALAAALGGCAGKTIPPTLTVRNDAMTGVDVHYAVLGVDGNPATPGEAGVQHLSIPAGDATTLTIDDPTDALTKIPRGQTAVRAFITLAGAGPESSQVLDLTMPPPFVVRVSPVGTSGFRAARVEDAPGNDRQYRELTTEPPPRPGQTRP